ncbi:GNAT family N-acetyltransferase [Gracilibacillus salinarum]|uniref:N-acetyltransferase n=1 Tax=Gracilibacillus salinarum TaxID=2932255 RepID=A0ABY4GRZ0_9BACI|nr:N-acetyltransferase [Gracilibacillus salinarum]UOQ87163.1 N-acetyltransferase [Gracilibacillus salinarum]
MRVLIRQETEEDHELTEKIIKKAFENEELSDHQEHLLVERLRASEAFIPELSLVALHDEQDIVGHILLSNIKIVDGDHVTDSLALAPVSVLPDYQNHGIGSQLIQVALTKAEELGFASVIVLGHPAYYPRFGFQRASRWGIQAPFDVPDDAFMALELLENSLAEFSGVVQYDATFG